jgi:serine/threonine protein kinase
VIERNNMIALVLEDFGATSLHAYAKKTKLSLLDVLEVGVSLSHALEHLHKAGLIHKDVSGATPLIIICLHTILNLSRPCNSRSSLAEHRQGHPFVYGKMDAH